VIAGKGSASVSVGDVLDGLSWIMQGIIFEEEQGQGHAHAHASTLQINKQDGFKSAQLYPSTFDRRSFRGLKLPESTSGNNNNSVERVEIQAGPSSNMASGFLVPLLPVNNANHVHSDQAQVQGSPASTTSTTSSILVHPDTVWNLSWI